MMKKTGAGLLRSCAGLFLLGACLAGWGTGAQGQEEATAQAQESAPPDVVAPAETPAPTESAAPVAAEPVQPLSFANANEKADVRLESARSLELEKLRELLKQTEEALPNMAKDSTQRNDELREARISASREAPEIQALYKEIEALQIKISAVTDTLPGVREKLDAYNEAQSALFEEMQFRTKLLGLIRLKEKAVSPASVPGDTP